MSEFASYVPMITSDDIKPTDFSLESFRELKVAFPKESDTTLARFLLMQEGNVETAKKLLSEHLVWRPDNTPVFKSQCRYHIILSLVTLVSPRYQRIFFWKGIHSWPG